jgi:hypothetical protein
VNAADHLAAADDALGELLHASHRGDHVEVAGRSERFLAALRTAWRVDLATQPNPSAPGGFRPHYFLTCLTKHRDSIAATDIGYTIPADHIDELVRLARVGLATEHAQARVNQFERLTGALRNGIGKAELFENEGELCCDLPEQGSGSGRSLVEAIGRALDDAGVP